MTFKASKSSKIFKSKKKILEGYSFLPKEFPEKWGFKIAIAYANLSQSLPSISQKTWTPEDSNAQPQVLNTIRASLP